MKKMKTFRTIILLLCLFLTGCSGCSGCSRGPRIMTVSDKTVAKEQKKERFIIVINDTGLIINKIEIFTSSKRLVTSVDDPDDISTNFKIEKTWEDYDSFLVRITDRYDLYYEKTVDVPEKGKVEVSITEDDYKKRKGDDSRLVDKWANEN